MSAYEPAASTLLVDHLNACPGRLRVRNYDSIYKREHVSLDRLGMDVWRYGILLYCDLPALLRVNWLTRRHRQLLADPSFIVEYQEGCWYLLPRYCRCERNLFYLNLPSLLDFSHDYRGQEDSHTTRVVKTLQDATLVLRHFGRTPDMLVQSFQRAGGSPPLREPLRVGYLDPTKSPLFCDGFTSMWIDNTIVPVPRMCNHPVEFRRAIHPGSFRPTRPGDGDPVAV